MTDAVFQSDFLKTMQARGYIHQITHPTELDAAAKCGVVTGYIASTPRHRACTSAI